MAQNRKFEKGSPIKMAVIAGTESGDAVATNKVSGVALKDRDSDGYAPVAREGVFTLSVSATTNDASLAGGASAVAWGDQLYVNASTGVVSKDSTGTVPLGYAMGAVSSGEQASIDVLIEQF